MKKYLVVFLTFVLLVGLLAGCSGKKSAASGQGGAASAGGADGYWRQFAGKEVTFATYVGGEADYLDSLLGDFYDLTGITVTIEQYPEDQLYQKVQIDTASRTGAIDVFTMDMMRIAEFAGAGYLKEVQPYIDNPNLTDKAWFKPEDILAGPLSAAKSKGVLYGIPYAGETSILFYRKDVLQQAGAAVPTTFDELLEVCKKIKASGNPIAPIAIRGQRGSGMNIYTWTQFFRGFGGNFFKDFPNDMTPTVNTPQAIAATKYYAELLQDYGPRGVANWTNMEIYTAQANGSIAMTMDANVFGAIVEDSNTSKTKGQWGYAVVPSGPGGAWPAIYAHVMCINSFSPAPEAAWLFIEWANSPDLVLKRGLKTGAPARESVWTNPEYEQALYYIGDGTYTKVCAESLQKADASYRPVFPNWNEMGDILGIAVQSVIAGGATAENAMNKAQADITAMLKNNGYIK
jgi:ABC-type glycerol-3-phosphate transport system substrate-binding protein